MTRRSTPVSTPDSGAGPIIGSDPERDLAAFLVSLPEQLALGDEDPAAIVDRYHSPDFEQHHDGIRLDRERLAQHARPARRNVVRVHTEVHDVLVRDDRFAARYTLTSEMRKGGVLVNDVFAMGRFAADGRIRRIDSTSRARPEAPA